MYMPGIFQQHASWPSCKSFLFLRPKALQLEAKVAQSLGVRECAMRHQRTAQLRTAQPSAHRTVSRCCAAIRCVRGGGGSAASRPAPGPLHLARARRPPPPRAASARSKRRRRKINTAGATAGHSPPSALTNLSPPNSRACPC